MIVCVCNAVSDKEVRDWHDLAGGTFEQLQSDLGVGTCCGRCVECACELLGAKEMTGTKNT